MVSRDREGRVFQAKETMGAKLWVNEKHDWESVVEGWEERQGISQRGPHEKYAVGNGEPLNVA